MNKIIIVLVLFLFVSAKPIEIPKTIEIDTERSQRYNEQRGLWINKEFIRDQDIKKEDIKKIVFNENDFLFPLENKKINSKFGISPSRYHLGTDYEAKIGDMILASKSGEVIEIGYKDNIGKYIIIEYSIYVRFTYAHLSEVYVRYGDFVEIGQLIGRVGISGRSTGPHLHLEASYQNVYMNPDLFFE